MNKSAFTLLARLDLSCRVGYVSSLRVSTTSIFGSFFSNSAIFSAVGKVKSFSLRLLPVPGSFPPCPASITIIFLSVLPVEGGGVVTGTSGTVVAGGAVLVPFRSTIISPSLAFVTL
ncbi:hypothetical protein D3C71_1381740 [compost metagenome]